MSNQCQTETISKIYYTLGHARRIELKKHKLQPDRWLLLFGNGSVITNIIWLRMKWRLRTKIPFLLTFFTLITLFTCEYLIYVIVQFQVIFFGQNDLILCRIWSIVFYFQCDWPQFNKVDKGLRVLFLADTHLLGPFRGHWFDKLRREWQMSTAFVTAEYLHSPDLVFFLGSQLVVNIVGLSPILALSTDLWILGDVFDEGQWVNEKQFSEYVKRFHRLFPTKNPHVVVGNHDVGFHSEMTSTKVKRYAATAMRIKRFKELY